MSAAVCRTCLAVLQEDSHEFFTLENSVLGGVATFREKLNCCIPELALDITPNAVICRTCSKTLNLAYSFKTKCLETETKVREYIKNISHECNTKREWCENSNFCHLDYGDELPNSPREQESADINCKGIKLENESDHKNFEEDTFMNAGETNSTIITNPFNIESYDPLMAQKIMNFRLSQQRPEGSDKFQNFNRGLNYITPVKLENGLCKETEFTDTHRQVKTQQSHRHYNYFTKWLQNLKENMKVPPSAYQSLEQFNLLSVMQSLANQGIEISHKTNEMPKQFSEITRNSPKLSLFKTHTTFHTGVKPFVCTVCGKGCSHKGELNNHLRTHTGEKPFKCNLCEASFSQISNMKIHMRTHTGEKPYKCDYCEKMFSHKCGVKVHMRTHTGERPYVCEICLKTYTHKKDLDDHMRTHTGEKYKCTICLKEITYKKNLSAHMVAHRDKNHVNLAAFKKNMVDYS